MMAPLLVALAMAGAAATGAWQYQANKFERRLSELRAEYLKRDLKALEVAHADTIRLQETKDAALAAAAVRQRDLARAAVAVRAERDGLRDELAAASRGLPSAACTAVREHAATLNTVFGECADRLEGLAGQAQGHASDAVMLQQAWPR